MGDQKANVKEKVIIEGLQYCFAVYFAACVAGVSSVEVILSMAEVAQLSVLM